MKKSIHYWIDKMFIYKHLRLINKKNRKKSRGIMKIIKLYKIIKNRERFKLRCATSADTQAPLRKGTSISK
jgi:hypothetical protein